MRWIKPLKQHAPEVNDERVINRFAFLPVIAWSNKDGLKYTVWLEKYKVSQVYKRVCVTFYEGIGFEDIWVDINNYID